MVALPKVAVCLVATAAALLPRKATKAAFMPSAQRRERVRPHLAEAALLQPQRGAHEWAAWADEVREAMRHTWQGYKAKAWGHDDIEPISGGASDWCRMAVTMLDGMSTLWLMGLKEEFNEAAAWIGAQQMPTQGAHGFHSLFEINIRALGGLLSAWDLSGNKALLDTAVRLADTMLHGFDNSDDGLPIPQLDVGTGETSFDGGEKVLAQVGTMQMEFRGLTHATSDSKYRRAVDRATETLLNAGGGRGLVPNYISSEGNPPQFEGSEVSFGAMGDSYYEYLLKGWIQSGKKEVQWKDLWKEAMREMMDSLVFRTQGGTTFVAESDGGMPSYKMDHLACFVAGMLMEGSRKLPKAEVDPRWEPTAAALTETCYQFYERSPCGLSPELFVFHIDRQPPSDMSIPSNAPQNLLRPEAAEAIFYMHYYTGDEKYRRMATEMWSAFQKNSKSQYGFSAVVDVRQNPPTQSDKQESFWLAETLKYFYLIFAPEGTLNLEDWVLNTEAHPFKIWSSTAAYV
mmetsp:Transcript_1529/g.4487  ORF Transcript_1529/g.4487 Transcript_1529/m.4487 type:complete len:515 (-) Transcript_1529:178-1722(-)